MPYPYLSTETRRARIINKPTLTILATLAVFFAASAGFADPYEEAVALLNAGWGDRAEAMLEDLAEQDPDRGEVWYQLAWARFHVEDFDEAEKRIDKAIKLEPDNPDFLVLQGHIVGRRAQTGSKLKSMGRGKKCRQCYERAIEVDPGHLEAYYSLIGFHLQAPGIVGGDKEKAPALAAAMTAADSLRGLLMTARVAEQVAGDLVAAEAALRRAMVVAERRDPSDFGATAALAWFYFRHDRAAETEEVLAGALENPDQATAAHAGLARLYLEQEKLEEAEAQWQVLVAADETRPQGLMGLGYLAQYREQWAEAVGFFDAVFASDPERGDAAYQAGRSRLMAGNYAEAAQGFAQYVAAELNLWWPSRAWGYARLSEALWMAGDESGAKKAWDEADDLKGHDELLKDKLKELKKAWEDPWEY